MKTSLLVSASTLVLGLLTAPLALAQPAQFVINNVNAPNVGFNDPTPAAPVGGNTGTTLGQQRLKAFEYAASLWAQRLNSPIPIRITAQFVPLGPGVLGSAGAMTVHRDFFNAPVAGTWYPQALANSLAGEDLSTSDDLRANFSTLFTFYLGLDNNAPAGQSDLVAVLLHEFAHGLGFAQFGNTTNGTLFNGLPDHYNRRLLDTSTGLYWPQMTNAQRLAAGTRFGRIVLDAPTVTADIPRVLVYGSPELEVLSPTGIAGVYQFGTAAFGPPVGNPNVQGTIVPAVDPADAAGAATTDGCSAFTNAAVVSGNIALVERGTCGFAVKARNATNAGAVAVIIYNNAANVNGAPPGMADDGINGVFVTIPAISVTRNDGLAFVAQAATGVTASIAVDPTVRAGADPIGRARVYAPFPVASGSSISHYDTVASRNLLMEPAINRDLTHRLKAPDDLTFELLSDVGWKFPDADGDGVVDDEDCNRNSDVSATIVIGGVDTGVLNTLFTNGCTMSDLLTQARTAARTHGEYVASVARLTNGWVSGEWLTGTDKGAVQSAAARTNAP